MGTVSSPAGCFWLPLPQLPSPRGKPTPPALLGRELPQTALKADSEELDVQSLQANVYEQATPMQAGKAKGDWVLLGVWEVAKAAVFAVLQCCLLYFFFEGADVCS